MDHSQAFKWPRVANVAEMREFFQFAFRRMQGAARDFGYALALHGSMQRDLDVVAAPWVDTASADIDKLAYALQESAIGIGSAQYQWEQKPHGRMATSFCVCWATWKKAQHTPGLGHVDLSVLPLRSALEASGWQPISTAPENHLSVLAYCDGFIVEAFRDVTWNWYLLSVGGPAKRMKVAPDFWMPKPPRPLPAPPEAKP